ncbi:TBC1 domain family member 7-like isoform X2 [Littorina saxatilis]|uniref:TBC1 domain family member 7-like isoform X2 n=1 Tax=Littorina saxatilis TaxID=31220 RepID=UPI0038B4CEA3
MAQEERNFRSYYYEKFGFRVVEEKKSIEILLKEQPVSTEKLKQFCLRFPLPAVYRIHVWKLLLGVLPANQSSQEFVQQQREQQFKDLNKGLATIRRVINTDPPELKLLKLYLLEQGNLPFEDMELVMWKESKTYTAMCKGVCKVTDVELDQYWVATRFLRHVVKYRDIIVHYPEITLRCLKKEDVDQKLWNHIVHHKLLSLLPLKDWFSCYFADVLPDISFQRIWDKVIGGSSYVMVYVAVAILIFFRRPLLSMKSSEDMVNYLSNIQDDCGDRIVNEALDLWAKNGSCLLVSKSDSPVVDKGKG